MQDSRVRIVQPGTFTEVWSLLLCLPPHLLSGGPFLVFCLTLYYFLLDYKKTCGFASLSPQRFTYKPIPRFTLSIDRCVLAVLPWCTLASFSLRGHSCRVGFCICAGAPDQAVWVPRELFP